MTGKKKHPENVVVLILGDEIRIKNVSDSGEEVVRSLGGVKRIEGKAQYWLLRSSGDPELATLLSKLRDHGFVFAGGASGWPPAAVFEDLREKGLIRGSFQEVLWSGPGVYTVRTR